MRGHLVHTGQDAGRPDLGIVCACGVDDQPPHAGVQGIQTAASRACRLSRATCLISVGWRTVPSGPKPADRDPVLHRLRADHRIPYQATGAPVTGSSVRTVSCKTAGRSATTTRPAPSPSTVTCSARTSSSSPARATCRPAGLSSGRHRHPGPGQLRRRHRRRNRALRRRPRHLPCGHTARRRHADHRHYRRAPAGRRIGNYQLIKAGIDPAPATAATRNPRAHQEGMTAVSSRPAARPGQPHHPGPATPAPGRPRRPRPGTRLEPDRRAARHHPRHRGATGTTRDQLDKDHPHNSAFRAVGRAHRAAGGQPR
jgi:hypothetical protein